MAKGILLSVFKEYKLIATNFFYRSLLARNRYVILITVENVVTCKDETLALVASQE